MQIVIDISESLLSCFEQEREWSALIIAEMRDVLRNGTTIPKGHGRLIDADKFNQYITSRDKSFKALLKDMPAVLEADKEVEHGKSKKDS